MKFLFVTITLLLIQCRPAEAADPNCMYDYYRTKPPGCVDAVLSGFREAPRPKSDPMTLIGFLAQLFRVSPDEKYRVYRESSEYLRWYYLVALYRGGLLDDAEKLARASGMLPGLRNLEIIRPTPLAEVRPSSAPGDNDLLIGAYMASGDTVFIQRILENFSSADDGMASDGMRLGLMTSKFGPSFTPKGRVSVMAPASCAKYQCKIDPAKYLRVLTLSTAFWALQSLAQQDEGIRKTSTDIFARDARLKNLLAVEQAAFGNYVAALAMVAAFKPDQISAEAGQAYEAMSEAASAYENLEPASVVFGHIGGLIKSGKPSK